MQILEIGICYNLSVVRGLKCMLCLTACMIMSYRMRFVVDEFGLKRNIRIVLIYSITMILSLVSVLLLTAKSQFRDWDPASLALIGFFVPIDVYLLVGQPVLEAMLKKREPSKFRTNHANDYLDFEGFLGTEAGFSSFRAHLEKEFCVGRL